MSAVAKKHNPNPNGRPVGSLGQRTKALRAVADQALVSGQSPLEVMLDNMRFWHNKVEVLQTALIQKVTSKGPIKDKDAMQMFEDFKALGNFRDKSQGCAVDAAPYVHVKLSATQVTGEITHKHEEAEKAFKVIENSLDAIVTGEIIPAREKAKSKVAV